MGTSIFGIGLSGLNAAQLGLATTSHNIANASTPGYNRQSVVQVNALPQFTGAGYIGQGTRVETVKRLYSQFLEKQVLDAETQATSFAAYHSQLAQIDNLLADPSVGLSPALQSFFGAVQNLANDPASSVARQALLSEGATLAARFHLIDERIEEVGASVEGQIAAAVSAINARAREIAEINGRIVTALNAGQPPNDLLDQRDHMIAELNKQVRVSTVRQDNGSINVFIGSGQAVVVDGLAYTFVAEPQQSDPARLGIGLVTLGGTTSVQESLLSGGELGGLFAFRSQSLEPARNALGRVAIGFASAFNDRHRLGQDFNGTPGGEFFTVPRARVTGHTANTGDAQISGTVTSAPSLTASDYRLEYDGTQYTVTRLADGAKEQFASLPRIVDGMTLTLDSGTPAAGDEFLIQPTVRGAAEIAVAITDGSRVAAAAPIRTAAALANLGQGKVSAGSVNSFNDTVAITFTGATTFNVVDETTGATLASNMTYTAGGNISFNGWTVQVAGAPAAGDRFTVSRMLTAATSATATIGSATLNTPSPTDTFLKNGVNVVFDSPTSYHLEGATNNVTGASSVTGGTFAPLLGALANGANPGITVTNGAATIGTGGAGAYTSTGAKVTISGGTLSGVGGGTITVTGATLTVEGGSYYGSTTFKGVTVTIDEATGAIAIPAAGAGGVASTFHGRPATGIAYDSTATNLLSVNGWTVELTGRPSAGDVFTVGANLGGTGDDRNALALAALQMQKTIAGETATFQSAYASLVSDIGIRARQLEIGREAQETALSHARTTQQSYSGVNLDEEAANLMRYQQAYQAAGKVMQIAEKLFATILELGN